MSSCYKSFILLFSELPFNSENRDINIIIYIEIDIEMTREELVSSLHNLRDIFVSPNFFLNSYLFKI